MYAINLSESETAASLVYAVENHSAVTIKLVTLSRADKIHLPATTKIIYTGSDLIVITSKEVIAVTTKKTFERESGIKLSMIC